jgi:hypothetical protein
MGEEPHIHLVQRLRMGTAICLSLLGYEIRGSESWIVTYFLEQSPSELIVDQPTNTLPTFYGAALLLPRLDEL